MPITIDDKIGGSKNRYNLKNALCFFLKKYRGNRPSVLLFNRKELEMIKDYFPLKIGSAYET